MRHLDLIESAMTTHLTSPAVQAHGLSTLGTVVRGVVAWWNVYACACFPTPRTNTHTLPL
jgi:hypothetical protein